MATFDTDHEASERVAAFMETFPTDVLRRRNGLAISKLVLERTAIIELGLKPLEPKEREEMLRIAEGFVESAPAAVGSDGDLIEEARLTPAGDELLRQFAWPIVCQAIKRQAEDRRVERQYRQDKIVLLAH